MERLYLQYQPVAEDIQQLIRLQTALQKQPSTARPVTPAQLHLTLIHFGIIDQVYETVRLRVSRLNYEQYRQHISDFVAAAELTMPVYITLIPTGLELFGAAQSVLVLRFQATAELAFAHQQALQALQRCFKRCGISDVEEFMRNDPNFRFALTLKPHVSLCKAVHTPPQSRLLPEKLQFSAMPSLYD